MQLRLSLAAAILITSMAAEAQDFVSVQYLQYNESDSRTTVSAPSIMINKDFGTDYSLNVSFVGDAVSGASPTNYDSTSGASAFNKGTNIPVGDIKYGNVEYEENRLAGSAILTTRFKNRDELSVGLSHSTESDFYSAEASGEYLHWLGESKNQSISFGASYQSNEILDKCAGGNIACDGTSGASQKETATAINAQLSYFTNIDSTSYAKATLFYSNDDGYLTNPYQNVVRNNNGINADVVTESRPDTRSAYGLGLKYTNALTDSTSLHLGYRYYGDDWGISSHTLDSDIYFEVANKWTFKLGLRYYMQSEADFYSQRNDFFTNEVYASSDQRLSDFDAITYKASFDYKISKDFSVNFGANFYDQSTDLSATYLVTGFRYNFLA